MNRVVITGRGAISPFGVGVDTLSDNVWQGSSGIRFMEEWKKIGGMKSHIAAPVPEINTKKYLPRSLRRTMGDMAIHATIAAKEAVVNAKIDQKMLSSGKVGVVIGSTTGSPEAYEEFYRTFLRKQSVEEIKSGFFFKVMSHSCAANVCLAMDINGEQWAPASACTSSSQALGLGYLLIKAGRQQAVLCGGADEVHHTVTMVFDVLKAASRKNDPPRKTPAPFDADRDGVVCGGGAGIMILESLDSALARGAEIYGELLGFGHVNDSAHIANPQEKAMAGAMKSALSDAGLNAEDIDYVNAHATGTMQGDIAEAGAIKTAVGNEIPVSSCKGHIGHTLGAAGVLESILSLEMIRRQELLPTLNLENIDPKCTPMNLIQDKIEQRVDIIMKNNFALGGVNTALIFRRWQ